MHLSAHLEPGRLLAFSQGLSPMKHCPQPAPLCSPIEPHSRESCPKVQGRQCQEQTPAGRKGTFQFVAADSQAFKGHGQVGKTGTSAPHCSCASHRLTEIRQRFLSSRVKWLSYFQVCFFFHEKILKGLQGADTQIYRHVQPECLGLRAPLLVKLKQCSLSRATKNDHNAACPMQQRMTTMQPVPCNQE